MELRSNPACECEDIKHQDSTCSNMPTFAVITIYGKFDLCESCYSELTNNFTDMTYVKSVTPLW